MIKCMGTLLLITQTMCVCRNVWVNFRLIEFTGGVPTINKNSNQPIVEQMVRTKTPLDE